MSGFFPDDTDFVTNIFYPLPASRLELLIAGTEIFSLRDRAAIS
jgi:hypothetical protein